MPPTHLPPRDFKLVSALMALSHETAPEVPMVFGITGIYGETDTEVEIQTNPVRSLKEALFCFRSPEGTEAMGVANRGVLFEFEGGGRLLATGFDTIDPPDGASALDVGVFYGVTRCGRQACLVVDYETRKPIEIEHVEGMLADYCRRALGARTALPREVSFAEVSEKMWAEMILCGLTDKEAPYAWTLTGNIEEEWAKIASLHPASRLVKNLSPSPKDLASAARGYDRIMGWEIYRAFVASGSAYHPFMSPQTADWADEGLFARISQQESFTEEQARQAIETVSDMLPGKLLEKVRASFKRLNL